MLSLARVSVHHGRTYYSKDNYYANERSGENSQWFGLGAETLGLTGAIRDRDFDRALQGRIGETSIRLTHGKQAENRAGIDLTFSAPKSVSLAALLGGDSRVVTAHRQAVEVALSVAEVRYAVTRIGRGGKDHRGVEVTGNFVAALFHHDTSRAHDPQLHTHCVVMNGVERSDCQWRSLHTDYIYANSKLLGLVYQNDLAIRLQSLGYEITVHDNGTFDLTGYSTAQLEAFSKRRRQLEELGVTNQKSARNLVKINRPNKGKGVEREALNDIWQREERAHGIVHPRTKTQGQGFCEEKIPYVETREVVQAALRHVTERDVTFRREAAERFALAANLGRLSWQEFGDELRSASLSGQILPARSRRSRSDDHVSLSFTTAEALAVEEKILSLLEGGRGRFSPPVNVVPNSIAKNTIGFSQDQRDAATALLLATDQFTAWQGVAGAGKTFALREGARALVAEGVQVKGFAPSAEAANVLAKEAGFSAETVAALLCRDVKSEQGPARERLAGKELWVVDEAGLMSARDCARLMERAHAERARVVFVGDTRQLSGVEAGNPFRLLQDHSIGISYLEESRRQKTEPLKRAAAAMAQGDVRRATHEIRDHITELSHESSRTRRAASDFVGGTTTGNDGAPSASTLLLTGTNAERERLTAAVRAKLKELGFLRDGVSVPTLVQKDLTREEIRSGHKIIAGDVLIFNRSYPVAQLVKGVAYTATHVDRWSGRIDAIAPDGECKKIFPAVHSNFAAFSVRERELAVGDAVRWTKNDKPLGLRNGQRFVVESVGAESLVLRGKDGERLDLARSVAVPLAYDYVSTIYSAQGKTADRVIVATDKGLKRESMYVALTRARWEVEVYAKDREVLVREAEVSGAKRSAVDVASPTIKRGLSSG